MQSVMAESSQSMEKRVEKLETDVGDLKGAVIQVTGILVEQSERVDAGFRQVHQEIRATREGLREEIRATREQLTDRMDGVNERLDRLIAVTMKERTGGVERLAEIERRRDKLEERAGT